MNEYLVYKESFDDFKKAVALTVGHDVGEEFDRFCLGAVYRIWGNNHLLYSPVYKELLKQIFGLTCSEEQILQSMRLYSDRNKKIRVPNFFVEIVDIDKIRKTDSARHTLGALYEFLALMALLNGDFTMEEAEAVNEVVKRLADYASENGKLDMDGIPENPKQVTEKNNSYRPVVPDGRPELSFGEEALSFDGKLKGMDDLLDFLGADGSGNGAAGSGTGGLAGNGLRDSAGNKTAVSTGNGVTDNQEQAKEEELPERSEEAFNALMEELNGLVGLHKVKEDIRTLLNFIKINKLREERGMKVSKMSCHLVFTGNPGTGKTTVARLVAGLYYQMGLLPKGQLIEADRSSLVAGYLGQTAIKTQEVIAKAMGGVLFIDEAYSLANDEQDSYGKEAIETILKAMEDHRDELVVIVAGYTDLMHKFINSNPGLNSRFNKYFLFPDYTGPELKGIFDVYCKKNGYTISEETGAELEKRFSEMYENRGDNFGNGRDIRNIFEKAINHQANRLAERKDVSDEELQLITMEDLEKALEPDEAKPNTGAEENKLEDLLKALKGSVSPEEQQDASDEYRDRL